MTAKPLIGISGSHMIDGGGQFPGYHRSYVNHDYVRSVTEAGGIPLIIPFNEEDDECGARRDALSGPFQRSPVLCEAFPEPGPGDGNAYH